MTTVQEALTAGRDQLAAAGIDGAAQDARWLMAAALKVSADRVILHLRDPLDADAGARYDRALSRRMAREPVSHILGGRWFYGRWFQVTGDVLDPRPETETLVDLALSGPFANVLDLGTGTGCIVLSLLAERPDVTGTGTDLSARALDVAAGNAGAFGLTDRVTLIRSDWLAAVDGRFDLIVSNPPYIAASEMAALAPELRRYEPQMALTDQGDGLSAYRAIAAAAPDYLAKGGRLMVEIGWTQGAAVRDLFQAAGLDGITIHADINDKPRVVSGRRG
ncbi:peptide chain release factor N(5)-glutamine methyltransferase [Rhodophyticola sp. CCM32]|uniref:peptide chain release factor N(5)-glutamine methyltransferase n=1 Tax=Rhodophyticola sp. CCM32 TaxID=2916397 RepID=UPI00107F0040|nr:peptide chain release factor N(5)-glutamine methyltransferase [Rhodophyticola sp. CCM32]QBX99972.1 peptide chain release factor N(5)-glutamine methyltransferase [Rhodophyticola sp. CCM32]